MFNVLKYLSVSVDPRDSIERRWGINGELSEGQVLDVATVYEHFYFHKKFKQLGSLKLHLSKSGSNAKQCFSEIYLSSENATINVLSILEPNEVISLDGQDFQLSAKVFNFGPDDVVIVEDDASIGDEEHRPECRIKIEKLEFENLHIEAMHTASEYK